MTTRSEEERLAVVENQITTLQTDVTEIKSDVKALVTTVQALVLSQAVREAADKQLASSRASTGVWVRWVAPLVFTVGNALFTAVSFFSRGN